MMQHITITRKPDPVTEERWVFTFFEDRMLLILDAYSKGYRPSPRHRNYVAAFKDMYVRILDRDAKMTEDQVPMPEDVVAEAREKLVSQIRVGLWERDYRGR